MTLWHGAPQCLNPALDSLMKVYIFLRLNLQEHWTNDHPERVVVVTITKKGHRFGGRLKRSSHFEVKKG